MQTAGGECKHRVGEQTGESGLTRDVLVLKHGLNVEIGLDDANTGGEGANRVCVQTRGSVKMGG